jgi:hypothetical protein
MRHLRPVLLILLIGLLLASAGLALTGVGADPDRSAAAAARPQACQDQPACGKRRIWLDPDKAHRFAEVFRS